MDKGEMLIAWPVHRKERRQLVEIDLNGKLLLKRNYLARGKDQRQVRMKTVKKFRNPK